MASTNMKKDLYFQKHKGHKARKADYQIRDRYLKPSVLSVPSVASY